MVSILELKHKEAMRFFLNNTCYFNNNLPRYFDFTELINKLYESITFDAGIKPDISLKASDYKNVNYTIFINKDSKEDFRIVQLIHPYLYVILVNFITEEENWNVLKSRCKLFNKLEHIKCYSLPVAIKDTKISYSKRSEESIKQWGLFEYTSLESSLKYKYMYHTDISHCYNSFYTHSIPWAIHGKDYSKERKRDRNLLGNKIDELIRHMQYGQTNGIPQGSILMDFIAEIILGYIDTELHREIGDTVDYKMIRYRDDYRIFTNDYNIAQNILKILSKTLFNFGLNLNKQKTFLSSNILKDSFKIDKYDSLTQPHYNKNTKNTIFYIHKISEEYPQSGLLMKLLSDFNKTSLKKIKTERDTIILKSILIDIMYKNPRTYPIIITILSHIIRDNEVIELSKIIYEKFRNISNKSLLEIWLQRLDIENTNNIEYEEPLCNLVNNKIRVEEIWNSEWCPDNIQKVIQHSSIIDKNIMKEMTYRIENEETSIFIY